MGPNLFLLLAALGIIAAGAVAVWRQVDVRLALLLAALALGALAGDIASIAQTFLATLANEQFVLPICCAMGFAYVLKHTECDQHLVHLLTRPLQRVRLLLIPGVVLVGFLVNIPVISQTSTAVAVGSVLVPLMRAARLSSGTIGAGLLLGASLGGELLNPGAPELITIANALGAESTQSVAYVFPLLLVQLAVATVVFWLISLRAERAQVESAEQNADASPAPAFRVRLAKAAVPLLPLALLFLTGPPLSLFSVPHQWLVRFATPADVVRQRPDLKDSPDLDKVVRLQQDTEDRKFSSRLIGAAMLVGVVAAGLVGRGAVSGIAKAFFDGAGYAFANIISLIVVANAFGKGVELIGLAQALGQLIHALPALLLPTAGAAPCGFAVLCGSGMAATQSLYRFFVEPAATAGADPLRVGAVVAIGAAAGRTMSPVSAVGLMAASLSASSPLTLAKRVAVPLLAGLAVVVAMAAMSP